MNSVRIKILEEYISKEPENPFNWYALAMEYYDESPSKSTELLNTLLTEHPEYLPSYYKAAHLYWDKEDFEKAKLIFTEGMELARKVEDAKTLAELKSSYQNLLFDMD